VNIHHDEKLRITSAGLVGIGTTNPQATLHVQKTNGEIARFGDITASSYEGLFIKNDVSSYPAIENSDSNMTIAMRAAGSIQMEIDANNNDTAKYFRVTTNGTGASGTELFRVQEDGKVGINEDDPYYNLQINFNNATTALSGGSGGNWGGAGLRLENDNTTAGSMSLIHFRTNDADWHVGSKYVSANASDFVFLHEGTNERLRITSGGKVGINTSIPQSDLQVITAGTSNQDGIFKIGGSDTTLGFVFDYDQAGSTVANITSNPAYTHNDALLKIRVDAVVNPNQLVLKGDGKVGIGEDSPGTNLHVKGTGTDILKIESTDAGAQGTNLILQHSPGAGNMADNDVISLLQFNGVDDSNNATTYSSIRAVATDVSNNSEKGDLTFFTRNGSDFLEKLRITSAGNVTTTGDSTFDRADAGFTARKGDCVSITRANGTPLEITRTTAQGNMINFFDTDATTQRANIQLDSNDLVFGLTTEKLRITSDGDVGIGTDNPTGVNAVSGNGAVLAVGIVTTNTLYGSVVGGITATGDLIIPEWIKHKDNTDTKFGFPEDNTFTVETAGTERLRITGIGSVGIGTNNPDELLHIAGVGTSRFRITDERLSIGDGEQYGVIQFEQRDANTPGVSVEMAAVMTDTSNGATALQFKTGTVSTIAERLRITSGGNLLLGTDTETNNIRLGNKFGIVGTTAYTGMSISNYSGTTAAYKPLFDFNRSRGTSDGSFVAVQADDGLGEIIFRGSGTSAFADAAAIRAYVDSGTGTAGNADMPGKLTFSTSKHGEATVVERLRIDSEGNLDIPFADNGTGLRQKIRFVTEANYFDEVAYISANRTAVSNAPTDLVFATGEVTAGVDERLRITSGGNVNIGGNFTETSHPLNVSHSTKPSLALHTDTTVRADFSATTGITSIRSYSNSPFTINIGGSGETEAFRIDGYARVLIGTNAYKSNLNSSADAGGQIAQFVGKADNTNHCVGIFAYSGTSNPTARGAKLQLNRARSTDGTTNTAVAVDDLIGSIEFKGNDATSFTTSARIDSSVDSGTVGTDRIPGNLRFYTSADNTAVPQERLRISSNGNVHLGDWGSQSTVYGKARLNIRGADDIATTFGLANSYLHIGGQESTLHGLYPISFGHTKAASTKASSYIGAKVTDSASYEKTALVFATRDATTDTEPDERLRITHEGDVGIGTINPTGVNALTGNTTTLAVGVVTATKFYGDIALDASTLTIDGSTLSSVIEGTTVDDASKASNLAGGSGQFPKLVVQTAANTTGFVDHSTNGNRILATNSGSTAFEWVERGITDVEVKQYSQGTTERTCSAPISVTSNNIIGIGSTSNAYGNKFVQTNDPTSVPGGSYTVCDGDLWYDTSDATTGGTSALVIGGIVIRHDVLNVGVATIVDFSTNLDVTAVSSGIVTITAPAGSFTGLTDTPANYTSQADKWLKVKSDASGIEFTDSPAGIGVSHDGSTVGVATVVNFSTNLDVTAVSSGIVTITATTGSFSSSWNIPL